MDSIHDLLTSTGRVLNRHAGKIYGFLPAIVIKDHDDDAQQKRHLRGMVQVYFPGLQDMGQGLIAPWARVVSVSAGGRPPGGGGGGQQSQQQQQQQGGGGGGGGGGTSQSGQSGQQGQGGQTSQQPGQTGQTQQSSQTQQSQSQTQQSHTQHSQSPTQQSQTQQSSQTSQTRTPDGHGMGVHVPPSRPSSQTRTPDGHGMGVDVPPSRQTFDGAGPGQAVAGLGRSIAYAAQDGGGQPEPGHRTVYSDGAVEERMSDGTTHIDFTNPDQAVLDGTRPPSEQVVSTSQTSQTSQSQTSQSSQSQTSQSGSYGTGQQGGGTGQQGGGTGQQGGGGTGQQGGGGTGQQGGGGTGQQGGGTGQQGGGGTGQQGGGGTGQQGGGTGQQGGGGTGQQGGGGTGQQGGGGGGGGSQQQQNGGGGAPTVTSGFYAMPKPGDEVLCAFEHGDIHRPYVIGSLWNGQDGIPAPVTDPKVEDSRPKGAPATPSMKGDSLSGGGGKNDVYFWRSRSGNLIALDDKNGVVRIADRSGTSTIQMSGDKVELMQSAKDVNLGAKTLVRFDCTDFKVTARKNVWMHANNDIQTKSGSDHVFGASVNLSSTSKGGDTSMKAGADISWKASTTLAVGSKSGSITITGGGESGIVSDSAKAELASPGGNVVGITATANFQGPSGVDVTASGTINATAGVKLKFKGAKVMLNSGGPPPGEINFGQLILGAISTVVSAAVSGAVAVGEAIVEAAQTPIGGALIGAAIGGFLFGPPGMVAGAAIGYAANGGELPEPPSPPDLSPGEGAAAGAAVGFAVGGPVGALVGAGVGYLAAGGELPDPPSPPDLSPGQGALVGAALGAPFGPAGMAAGAAIGYEAAGGDLRHDAAQGLRGAADAIDSQPPPSRQTSQPGGAPTSQSTSQTSQSSSQTSQSSGGLSSQSTSQSGGASQPAPPGGIYDEERGMCLPDDGPGRSTSQH